MSNNHQADIEQMHAAYVKGTGLSIPLTMQAIMTWEHLWARPYEVRAADVALVIGYVKKLKRQQKPARDFRFSNFVGRSDLFAEDLAAARADARIARPDPARAAALQATGRPAAATPQPGGRLDAAPMPEGERAGNVLRRVTSDELRVTNEGEATGARFPLGTRNSELETPQILSREELVAGWKKMREALE
jgi:hypothetical protein